MKIVNKFWLFLIALGVVYVCYAYFVLSPSSYRSFSLIDDGQTIQNSSYFTECITGKKCENLGEVLVEKEFGRFRPAYWAINYLFFSKIGLNPVLHHQFRIYVIGLFLSLAAGYSVLMSGGKKLGALISSAFFFTSYTFTENMVRLGPGEPYQLVFIALFIWNFLANRWKNWPVLIIVYIFAILTKETSFVLIFPALIVSFLFPKGKHDKRLSLLALGIGLLLTVVGRKISAPLSGDLAYSENYQFQLSQVFQNSIQYLNLVLNITRPFSKILLLLGAISFSLVSYRKVFYKDTYVFWFSVFIFFTGILIPWRYILERYLFLSIFSFSIILGLVVSDGQRILGNFKTIMLNKHFLIASHLIFITLILNLFFYNLPFNIAKTLNYRSWYSMYLNFERDQIQAIVNSNSDLVYIDAKDNIDNWEVLYEIPIHLKYIYNRDVSVKRVDSMPQEGYLFTRSSLARSLDNDDILEFGYKKLASQNYEIKVIDVLNFTEAFHYRPVSSFFNIKYLDQNISYSWDIYKK